MAVIEQADFKNFATSEVFTSELSELMVNSIAEDNPSDLFTVYQDVTNGEPLSVVDPFDKVTKTDPGCGDNSINKTIGGFQQKWNVKDLSVHVKWCWKDFQNAFVAFGFQKGIRKADLTAGQIGDFLELMGNTAITTDFGRIMLMGNESAATVANGGYFNNSGVDINDYNQIERGLDATLSYLATIARFQKNFVYIPQNEITGKQYQYDGADGTKKVSTIARELKKKAKTFRPDHQICNYAMIQGFEDELLNGGAYPIAETRDALVDGIEVSRINGINTFSSQVYDAYTASDTTGIFSGASAGDYHNPNFMILTTKDNLLMGMDEQNAISDTKWFLDDIKDEVHFKCKYRADFKIWNPDHLLAGHSYNPDA